MSKSGVQTVRQCLLIARGDGFGMIVGSERERRWLAWLALAVEEVGGVGEVIAARWAWLWLWWWALVFTDLRPLGLICQSRPSGEQHAPPITQPD